MKETSNTVNTGRSGKLSPRQISAVDTLLSVACWTGIVVLLVMVAVGDKGYTAPAFGVAVCLIAKVHLRVKRLEAMLRDRQVSNTNPTELSSTQARGET